MRAREDFDSSPAPRPPRFRPSLQLQQRGDQLFLSGRKPGKLPLVELSVKAAGAKGREIPPSSAALPELPGKNCIQSEKWDFPT